MLLSFICFIFEPSEKIGRERTQDERKVIVLREEQFMFYVQPLNPFQKVNVRYLFVVAKS